MFIPLASDAFELFSNHGNHKPNEKPLSSDQLFKLLQNYEVEEFVLFFYFVEKTIEFWKFIKNLYEPLLFVETNFNFWK